MWSVEVVLWVIAGCLFISILPIILSILLAGLLAVVGLFAGLFVVIFELWDGAMKYVWERNKEK